MMMDKVGRRWDGGGASGRTSGRARAASGDLWQKLVASVGVEVTGGAHSAGGPSPRGDLAYAALLRHDAHSPSSTACTPSSAV